MTDTYALLGTELKTFPGFQFGNNQYDLTFNDSADSAVVIFQAPEPGDITGMTGYCKSVAGTSPYYKFQLQGVDGSGNPDGSNLAETAKFQASATTAEAHAFTSAYTCTQGQLLCGRLVYADDGSTIDGSNNAVFTYVTSKTQYNLMPYAKYWNGSAWYGSISYHPTFTLQTSITGYDFGGIYNIGKTSSVENITTSGDRYAQRILIPSGEAIELHVDGFRFYGNVENSSGAEFKIGVWPASGAALAETSIDSSQQLSQMATVPYSRDYIFDDDVTLAAGTVYYMGIEHIGGGAGNDLNISYLQPAGLDGLKSWPGGAAFYAAKYSSAAWVDDNTRRLLLNPIISSIHGSGGGGSTTRPTMGVIG